MNITLLCMGQTEAPYLKEGLSLYSSRIRHYLPFELKEPAAPRKWSGLKPEAVREREGALLLKHMEGADVKVLLDEHGKQYDSVGFSRFIQQQMNRSTRNLVFVVGGAWGFSDPVREAAGYQISLSRMTFSHQMVRLFFLEQLYRALTLWRGESYHNG